ncbi:HAD family hydrolase [Bdellovibrio svalbardensis]|uniref:phosphoglycolate phosphatase n=1 Tax=Bdellovibrio svalbardensis TaxID=2972972 RepID=A0ABT6DM45_9BACT|nr:HAD hydrolase-like protein [Bdellovibrio svalbardensis]MDG0817145.1 HAD hydrolase-like protein [Bdellovibrio svalbardensis]
MNQHPLLVFDLDGTLIDSAPDIITAVNRTLTDNGKPAQSDAEIIAHIGEGLKKLIADLFKADNLEAQRINELELEFLHNYHAEMLNKTRIFPGVEEFLGSYPGPIAIITNKNEAPAKKIVEHLKLHRFPWVNIFGADTLEERKPSPLPLRTMMKLAGHGTHNTIMIGDGIPDMVSAQNAGVPSIAIDFGYTAPAILKKYEPRGILKHYNELHKMVNELFPAELVEPE